MLPLRSVVEGPKERGIVGQEHRQTARLSHAKQGRHVELQTREAGIVV